MDEQNVSKEDFLEWRNNRVTKAVFETIEQRIQDAREILGNTAGDDPVADRYLVGMIRGFSEIKEITYED